MIRIRQTGSEIQENRKRYPSKILNNFATEKEFITWPRHQNTFYKITSNAINFQVRALCNAGIGLSSMPGPSCDFMICIGYNNHSIWIRDLTSRKCKESFNIHNILKLEMYRQFWISWYGDIVRLGIDGTAIISLKSQHSNLKYVTFTVIDDNSHPIFWRIELPPLLERPLMKPITGGELCWVQVDEERKFPAGAYIGGYEKENLYIIRAHHRGSLIPGKFVASERLGYIPWGGNANAKNSFEVLCGFDCMWMPSKLDNIPVGAVIAGYSEYSGHEKLYIGRAKYLNHLIPGKVQPTHKVCYVPYDGKEVGIDNYEIMIVPEKNRGANNFLVPGIEYSMLESDDDNEENDDNSMN